MKCNLLVRQGVQTANGMIGKMRVQVCSAFSGLQHSLFEHLFNLYFTLYQWKLHDNMHRVRLHEEETHVKMHT